MFKETRALHVKRTYKYTKATQNTQHICNGHWDQQPRRTFVRWLLFCVRKSAENTGSYHYSLRLMLTQRYFPGRRERGRRRIPTSRDDVAPMSPPKGIQTFCQCGDGGGGGSSGGFVCARAVCKVFIGTRASDCRTLILMTLRTTVPKWFR